MSPSQDDVRRQLERLLASAVLANVGRMSRLRELVVERTLERARRRRTGRLD